MDLTWGFNLSVDDVRLLNVLEQVHTLVGGQGGTVPLAPLFGPQVNTNQLVTDFGTLRAEGLILVVQPSDSTVVNTWRGAVTPAGEALLASLHNRRTSVRKRKLASYDAALHWLDHVNNDLDQRSPHVGVDQMGDWGIYLGEPFTDDEILKALAWLEDEGYIRGGFRPDITAKGERVVRRGRSVTDPDGPAEPGATHNTVNVTGDLTGGQVQMAGAHSAQHQTQRLTDEHRRQVAALVDYLTTQRATAADLDPEAGTEIAAAVDDLRAGLRDDSQMARLERGLRTVERLGTTVAKANGALGLAATSAIGLLQLTGLA